MANAPESILAIWKALEARGCKLPVEMWGLWEPFLGKIHQIRVLVDQSNGGDLPVDCLKEITVIVGDVQRFIRSIRSASDARVDGDLIYVEPDVLQLIVHYIGNDLYVIALVADVPKNNPQPAPASDARHIIERVTTIEAFVSRLKAIAG